ncbi:predicted protein [Sclerotinia sclerotiorum 1980 UF-70]|uniref:Uncharacterized protein n=1 Tax=Sclerotinia sclerotiorum (strain ATCC 18683 / 1980 / Ss-1) TaxID=665079 RepID=A7ED76_SCLS1|nr:predicted protein [Sclerotinia sclerotiorum 1980 UF-70]EDO00792.1 predicted protein [Sclerotinia sclerotiorum 1980 UF-70]
MSFAGLKLSGLEIEAQYRLRRHFQRERLRHASACDLGTLPEQICVRQTKIISDFIQSHNPNSVYIARSVLRLVNLKEGLLFHFVTGY